MTEDTRTQRPDEDTNTAGIIPLEELIPSKREPPPSSTSSALEVRAEVGMVRRCEWAGIDIFGMPSKE